MYNTGQELLISDGFQMLSHDMNLYRVCISNTIYTHATCERALTGHHNNLKISLIWETDVKEFEILPT